MDSLNSFFSLDDFITNNETILNMNDDSVPFKSLNNSFIHSSGKTSSLNVKPLDEEIHLNSWDFIDNEQLFTSFDYSTIDVPYTTITSSGHNDSKPNIDETLNSRELPFDNDIYQMTSNTSSSNSISSSREDLRVASEVLSSRHISMSSVDEFDVHPMSLENFKEVSDTLLTTPTSSSALNRHLQQQHHLSHYNGFKVVDDLYDISSNPSPKSNVLNNQLDENIDYPRMLHSSSSSSFRSNSEAEDDPSPSYNSNISVSSTPASGTVASVSASSSNSTTEKGRRSSLDSRLSLQKLGDILQTSSLEETIKVEKFILDIFVKDLGFPLGYKTWIRDTNEKYRYYLLEELYKRTHPKYPSLTKSSLETVVKRATYSLMQGRLRKERRAATKMGKRAKHGK